jgi:AcrR family transcriptional regulator
LAFLQDGKRVPLRRTTSPKIGLREQNKFEKRQRIREAARELFSSLGYDAATLRQIARRAHVGLGTLFLYAQDKRDLVFLIFNEELDFVTNEALAAAHSHRELPEQLMAIFERHYRYFGKDPEMSRILLKELVFYSEGKQAATFLRIRERLLSGIEMFVRSAQQNLLIRSKEAPEIIARHLFFVFSAEIRWWIANDRPNPTAGLNELRRLIELQIHGLKPATNNAVRRSRSTGYRKTSASKSMGGRKRSLDT